jgi:WD40 repeat protein
MSLSGDVVNPNKMILTEQDTKVLIKDNTIGNTVFFMDLEKGKVIQELTTNNYLEDIAPSGKLSFMGTDSMFYACARQNIMMMDPRTASSVVQQRPYATDYKFNTITTAQNGQYAVGSSNGEIRLYGSVGGNAKNVIPSFNNEAILSMDASKDGKFLLTCTKSNVMLIKTSQAGKNGFDYMFRKGDKPRPIPLKIHASALAKHGIAKPQFKFAKFDQKEKGLESFIVACVGEHMIFWSMKKL